MRFEFATAGRILFGEGTAREVAPAVAAMGRRALVVTGSSLRRAAPILEGLHRCGVEWVPFAVHAEPTTEGVRDGTRRARESGCEVVVGIGGGSVLDAAKAIAALLTNGGDPLDYLEVVGRGEALRVPPAPYVAVPTTAGTGSEVTRNAVLTSPEHQVKASLRSPMMLPRLAVVDPELTMELPPEVTAATGLDALTQLIEPFVSARANPLVDGLCREGMQRAARSLRRAWANGLDVAARRDMALASLLGGLALANAGLGAVHGFAGPIGGMFPAPHGAVCARLLPVVMEANVRALAERDPENPARWRYQEVAEILTGQAGASAQTGAAWVRQLVTDLRIPALGSYGMTQEAIPAVVERAAAASSMQANPIRLGPEEMAAILREAL